MKTAGMTALILSMLLLGASRASAEAALAHDPLTKQIMRSELTSSGGGVTAAVRLGSGQTIVLDLADPLTSPPSGLKDAVADTKALGGLKPAAGLAPKAEKTKTRRKVRRDSELLRKMSDDGRKADWAGRK
jgi:hypothetical protein